jgi:hypothetical protein
VDNRWISFGVHERWISFCVDERWISFAWIRDGFQSSGLLDRSLTPSPFVGGDKKSVLRIRYVYHGSVFFHPGSSVKKPPDPGSAKKS